MDFLSHEWLTALDDAVSGVTLDPDTAIVIEQTVSVADSEVCWHMVVADGRIRVLEGSADSPDVKLRCGARSATAIAAGRLSALRAFLDGRITLEGDTRALRAARAGLEALDDAFVAVRERTTGLG